MPPVLPSEPLPPTSDPATYPSRPTTSHDLVAIEALHDAVFGPGALTRAAYRVREGEPPVSPFCRVLLHDGAVIAAIRFTRIRIGGVGNAVMLGPLAVAADYANQGHGRRLIAESIATLREAGVALVLLVGDASYYARYGFKPAPAGKIVMPAPVDPARLLALELIPGAAASYTGRVIGASENRDTVAPSPERLQQPLQQ